MLRKLLDGHILCEPIMEAGKPGSHFTATGTFDGGEMSFWAIPVIVTSESLKSFLKSLLPQCETGGTDTGLSTQGQGFGRFVEWPHSLIMLRKAR